MIILVVFQSHEKLYLNYWKLKNKGIDSILSLNIAFDMIET